MNLLQKLLGLVILSVLSASPGYAEIKLTGKHNLISVQPNDSGSFLIFRVTIRNSGTSTLSKVRLVATDPQIVADKTTNSRIIENLPSGSSVALDWNVNCECPSSQLTPGMDIPFVIQVEAIDDAGGRSEFYVDSTVVTKQNVQVSHLPVSSVAQSH